MGFSFTYQKTVRIQELLTQVEVVRRVIEVLPGRPHIEENLRRATLLQSSLYSARIEGNTLRMEDVAMGGIRTDTEDLRKREIANLVSAYSYLRSLPETHQITPGFFFELHRRVMLGLSDRVGSFRSEPSAIFNMAGVAVYVTPPPQEISHLLSALIEHCGEATIPAPIRAALTHIEFEKIHPFLDGNGRVGRLLCTYVLQQGGYGLKGLASFEQYLEQYRDEYYTLLAGAGTDRTDFVEFFLQAVVKTAEESIRKLQMVGEETPEHRLLPRRQELLSIIRDHPYISFDALSRRFPRVNKSTLHNDLSVLLGKKYIEKVGETRGVSYI